MADFYDKTFPEPPTFEQTVFDYIAYAYRRWSPLYIPQKVAEKFGISIEEAEKMYRFWCKINRR